MEAVLVRPNWPPESRKLGPFANWLLCWVVLPNLPFCFFWFIGGPSRAIPILVTGCIGLALHRAPFAIRFPAFLFSLALSTAVFIAGMFNLSVISLTHSLKFATELRPEASLQYIAAILALAATIGLGWNRLRQPTTLSKPLLLVVALLAAIALGMIDQRVAVAQGGSYHRSAPEGAAFESAVAESGFEKGAAAGRHMMIVMVESMGEPIDAQVRRQLLDIWAPAEVRARYEVSSGSTLYYGSTTSGEMRELCGRWGDYHELLRAPDPRCLPHRMKARGFDTQAWHSFTGGFFDRTNWYPNAGFETMRFGDEIMAAGALRCPGVFPGACDDEVPAQIAATLKQAKEPQFLYWLTVNAHLPVIESERLGTTECHRFDARLEADYPMICRLFQIYSGTGEALAKEIVAEDFPDTDILIVGDHIPPFFDRHHRMQFAADRVPWILLRAKERARPAFRIH